MDFVKRKPTRLYNYDYSNAGAYFITICTKNKKALLSKIVGEGLCALPKTELTSIGTKVHSAIEYICSHYENVNVDNYVIMPNHIHLLIRMDNMSGGHRDPPLQDIIARFKSFTTTQYGKTLWQRSFYDHIIRNETDYYTHFEYIQNNPAKWAEDELYQKN